MLITFEPHPRLVLANGEEISVLTTVEEKIEILEKTGLDHLVVANFTQAFAATSAEQFVRNYLVEKFHTRAVFVGPDHMFGRKKEGDYRLLQQLGQQSGFQVFNVEPIELNGKAVSSTLIRRLLSEGSVARAARLLGRPYNMQGRVVRGQGQGRELGFPTANLRPTSRYKLFPKEGIYAARVKIGDGLYDSAAYIGVRPTFNGTEKVAEVHVPGFNGNLYDRDIEIFFHAFLRDDQKFDTTAELAEQIKQDIQNAIHFLEHGGKS